jgi:hypothetical protein
MTGHVRKSNNEARSCNDFCSGKAINIIDSECVFVALGIPYAMRMRHIVIYGMCGSKVYFHFISSTAPFKKKLLNVKCLF